MKINKRIFVAAVLLTVIFIFAIAISQRNSSHSSQESQDVYYCPMHPTYTSDKPGDCPICNMKLVKKEKTQVSPQQNKNVSLTKDICLLHNCPMAHEGKPCPMLVMAKEGEEVICPLCGRHVIKQTSSPKEKKILYWTDPMIPGYKSDKPGKSPMGMDMVPVYEAEGTAGSGMESPEGYTPILVTPQKQQLIGIRTALLKKKDLIKTIRTVGTIAHDPELYQAQSEYIQAIQAYERSKQGTLPEVTEQAKHLVDSTQIRLKHLGLSDEMIEEMSTWKEAQHSLLFAHPGDPVWMYAQIYEYELPLIKIGQEVMVNVQALPGEQFKGKVKAIDRMVDPSTRTTRIRAILEDPEGHLKPDMFVDVNIQIDLGGTLALPKEAVFNTGIKKIVFIDQGQGLFEPRDVVLGAETEDDYEVKSGISEGERVVTSGNFLIDSESRLKAAVEGMSGSSGELQHGK